MSGEKASVNEVENLGAKANSGQVKCLICGEIFDASLTICPVCGLGPENFQPVEVVEASFKRNTNESFIIIGGGTAALHAAEAIRERNDTARIIMFGEEKDLPYDRPMLTKNMFGAISNGAIASKEKSWYEENNIVLILDTKIVKIDKEKKEVQLLNEAVLPYDKCIYATGSYNFVPPFKNVDLEKVTSIRTISDVEALNQMAQGAKSAVVIGGGVLGLEAAWELKKQNLAVTVLEGAPSLMAGRIDATAAEMLIDLAAKAGITIKTNVKITGMVGEGTVSGVMIEDGVVVEADLVLVSTGVRANIGVAQEAGVLCERAVIVDSAMKTSEVDIYACGDCAQYEGANIAIWPVAMEMGRVAGANAAGDLVEYIPTTHGMSFSGMETSLFVIGDAGTGKEESYQTLERIEKEQGILEQYFFKNKILCGAILIGDKSKMGAISTALETGKSYEELSLQM